MFSKFQRGFWKGFNVQQCLLTIVEKWRKTLDKGDKMGAVLTDLSKAFGCIDQNLLIAKLNLYGFENSSLQFSHSYFSMLKQRTKIDSVFSSLEVSFSDVSEGAILVSLCYVIFISSIYSSRS